jgi:hypothetical protein
MFSELTLIGRGYVFLDRVGAAQKSDLIFLVVSFSIILIFAVLFWSAARRIYSLYQSGYHPSHQDMNIKITGALRSFLPLVVSAAGYCFLGAAVLLCRFLNGPFRFVSLKFIAEAACILAAVGCAYEILLYARKEQSKILSFVKVASHVLVVEILLIFLYKQTSFQGMILP